MSKSKILDLNLLWDFLVIRMLKTQQFLNWLFYSKLPYVCETFTSGCSNVLTSFLSPNSSLLENKVAHKSWSYSFLIIFSLFPKSGSKACPPWPRFCVSLRVGGRSIYFWSVLALTCSRYHCCQISLPWGRFLSCHFLEEQLSGVLFWPIMLR